MKKILLFCFLFLFLGSAQSEELVIAHITDTHLGYSKTWDQRFADILWLANPQAQIVFITGDITSGPNKKKDYIMMTEFVDMVQNLTIPWLAVRGNHDNPSVYQEIVGPLEWVYDTGSYRIIGIDTLNVNFERLYQWLTFDKILIVIGHQPLNCGLSPCMKHSVATELRQIFKTYKVLLYCAGHDHPSVVKIKVDTYSETVLLTAPGARDGNGYGLITIKDSMIDNVVSIKVKVVEIPIDWEE